MPKITLNTILSVLAIGIAALFVGRYFYMKPSMINGEIAPAFSADLRNGETFQLKELRGQYVLLDFWGSWCPPCRAENPALVRLYEKYKNASFKEASGFNIVGIGIEEEKSRWERAIKRDGLSWPYHIYDEATSLRFFDSRLAKLYSVKEVPTKYLLNPQGRIIAVNPSPEQIDQLLAGYRQN